MPDSDTEPTPAPGLPAEISSSLASVWNQYASERPSGAETVIRGNRIKCVLTDAVQTLNDGLTAAETDDSPDGGRRLTPSTFRNDAIAAVKRVTRRQVVAFVSDHDAKTDVATEVFLLEAPPYKQRSRVSHTPGP
ncbi:MAG TPA: hypothetical protein VEX12_11070 [Microbacterium sp.]|jgi:hypothetical protein|nr:hypothetical protein [Microbacterium sp.]